MIVYESNNHLEHHGILGQKWGVRRYQNKDGSLTSGGKRRYSSTGLKSAMARRQNEKIDASFKSWNENSQKKSNAIELGKASNKARMEYETNKNKNTKKAYKDSQKEYKKALRGNTTYRKGQIRQEVGSDMSRKYLSAAKKVGKQLDADPTNKELQKQYNSLMSSHDVERASARKAASVGAARSQKQANVKRMLTTSVKTVAATAAVTAGLYAANRYLTSHEATLNGQPVQFSMQHVNAIKNAANLGKEFMSFIY